MSEVHNPSWIVGTNALTPITSGEQTTVLTNVETWLNKWWESVVATPYIIAAALQDLLKEIWSSLDISELIFPDDAPYSSSDISNSTGALKYLKNLKVKSQQNGVDILNYFLKENGFNIQLKEASWDSVSVVAINEVKVKYWVSWKRVADFELESGKNVVAALLEKWLSIIETQDSFTNNPIVKIATEDWGSMYVTRCENPPWEEELWNQIKDFYLAWKHRLFWGGWKVIFPMIDHKVVWGIEWLKWVSLWGGSYISEALRECILKVNHQWAISKTAVAMTAMRWMLIAPKNIEIRWPFILWFETPDWLPLDPYYLNEQAFWEPDMWEDGQKSIEDNSSRG